MVLLFRKIIAVSFENHNGTRECNILRECGYFYKKFFLHVLPDTSINVKNERPAVYSKKVKGSRYRPGVAQSVARGIALLFHGRG